MRRPCPQCSLFRALFVMVWKFIIIALTDLGMHKTPFTPRTIWRSAVRRFVEKARACEWGAKIAIDRASGRGEPHNIGAKNKALTPLGGLDEEGILSWCPDFQSELDRLLFGAPSDAPDSGRLDHAGGAPKCTPTSGGPTADLFTVRIPRGP